MSIKVKQSNTNFLFWLRSELSGTGWGVFLIFLITSCTQTPVGRVTLDFNANWKFFQGDDSLAFAVDYNDSSWRKLNLPHDWSIEGEFSDEHPTRINGGALPAGIGWYRKTFTLAATQKHRQFFIEFDGVYRNSEVWINGNYLGKRPFGYIGFRYDLTPYLRFDKVENVLAVKVDNSEQPNSRWYTGSGIYRNVWLVSTGKAYVDHWGTFVTTPIVTPGKADVHISTQIKHAFDKPVTFRLKSELFSPEGVLLDSLSTTLTNEADTEIIEHRFNVANPRLWSFETPNLYSIVSKVFVGNKQTDQYTTRFGIRSFRFDAERGFFLNGENSKLKGVNNHHDLGALGAAFNTRAAERQLEILKKMGCNAIRMAHNPPAPELLDLCDRMGFFVMEEAFDVWKRGKMKKDYQINFEEWHERDLRDMVLRARNHPSVMAYSIGNEIPNQFDSLGTVIASKLAAIVKSLDTTRPVTCALTENNPEKNFIYKSGALDLLSFNYKHKDYPDFPKRFPGEPTLASENMSAFATRGVYNQPSDSLRIWPEAYNVPIKNPNPDFTCSAYDHVHAYWGATHEETWKMVKRLDFLSGMFIWSGFDFLGEPDPYKWPARSSYYGVIDLAGFPKDVYYLYQSEWTNETMLHLFPHWNWKKGETIDVWAYYNNADEVELFLNGQSMGIKSKNDSTLHVMWRVKYEPGTIKAVSRLNGQIVLEREIHTAGSAAKIELTADRTEINADGYDLSFVTVRILDAQGNLVPNADHLVRFNIKGNAFIAGTDNGYQASHEPFKSNHRKAFNGMCLAIVQSNGKPGNIVLEAVSDGLQPAELKIQSKKKINKLQ